MITCSHNDNVKNHYALRKRIKGKMYEWKQLYNESLDTLKVLSTHSSLHSLYPRTLKGSFNSREGDTFLRVSSSLLFYLNISCVLPCI